MSNALVCFRIFLGVLNVIILALLMWGLKAGMQYMGRDFAVGVATGFMGCLLLLTLHWKVTGKSVFES